MKSLSEPFINYGELGNFSIAGFELLLSRKISPYITSYYLPSGDYLGNDMTAIYDAIPQGYWSVCLGSLSLFP